MFVSFQSVYFAWWQAFACIFARFFVPTGLSYDELLLSHVIVVKAVT